MVGMTTRLRRTRNRLLGIKPPSLNCSQMRELGTSVAEALARGIEQGRTAPRPPVDPNWKPPLQLTTEQYANLMDALEALGWTQDWGYEGEGVGVYWPNPKWAHWITQQANALGSGWISWREENGTVIYSLSDDRDSTADRVDIDTGGSEDAAVIATAIDRALHVAQCRYADGRIDELIAENAELRRVRERVGRLARFPLVTSGKIRAALAEAMAAKP